MPATFGGQLTIVLGVILSFLAITRVMYKAFTTLLLHIEWLEQLWIIHARETGMDVPEWLIKKHMKLNGNERLSSTEKDRLYGHNRDRVKTGEIK